MPKPTTPTPEPKPEEKPEPTNAPAPDPKPEKTYTQAQWDLEMKKLQKDADKKIADAEAKAKLSEDERKDAELAEAKRQLEMRDKRDAVIEAAEKAGIKNPRLFFNAYKDEIEMGDGGKIKNLDDILTSAKTESPELFGVVETPKPEGSADAGTGKTPPSGLTKEAIEAMSDDDIAKNMDAIDAFMATQK